MALSVHQLREFAPGHGKSSVRAHAHDWRSWLTWRKIGLILFRFLASIIATVSIVIMGWALITSHPRGENQEYAFRFESERYSDSSGLAPEWLNRSAPPWLRNGLAGLRDSFFPPRSRDRDGGVRSADNQGAWFTLSISPGSGGMAASGGGLDLSQFMGGKPAGRSDVASDSDRPSVVTPIIKALTPSKSATAARPAPTPTPARPVQEARAVPPAVAVVPTAPAPAIAKAPAAQVATAKPAPAERPVPPAPVVATSPTPVASISPEQFNPMETRLDQAIRAARADFRLTTAATDRLRQYADLKPPAGRLDPFERQMSDLLSIQKLAANERSTLDFATDKFTAAQFGDKREADIATCLKANAYVSSALIARKSVAVQPGIPAFIALVEAKSDRLSPEKVEAGVRYCLSPLNSDGTVSLLLNSDNYETKTLAAKLRAVEGAFVHPHPLAR